MIKMGSMVLILWSVTQNRPRHFKHERISTTARGRPPANLDHHIIYFIGVLVVIIITTYIVIIFTQASQIRRYLPGRN